MLCVPLFNLPTDGRPGGGVPANYDWNWVCDWEHTAEMVTTGTGTGVVQMYVHIYSEFVK